jgi:hypothetical protein
VELADRVVGERTNGDAVAEVDDDDLARLPTRPRLGRDGHLSVAGDRHHVTGGNHDGIVYVILSVV